MKKNDLYVLYAKGNNIKEEVKEVKDQEEIVEPEIVDSKKKNKFLNSVRNEHI